MTGQRSILVAVDLPPERADFGPVFELARWTGWNVHLLHAAAPEPAFVGYDETGGPHDEHQRQRELADEYEQLTEYVAVFKAQEIEAEAHVEMGPTVEVIIRKAEEWDAAFIVVVGHKHNVAHRVVLGSVASTLLKVARRPVLVLPTQAAANSGLEAAVDRLIDLIDREESAADLTELRQAAEAQLAEPESDERRRNLSGRLRESVEKFELEHLSLSQAIGDVSYYLSGLGI